MNNPNIDALLNLKRQYSQDLQAVKAAALKDPGLNPQGVLDRVADAAKNLGPKYATELARLTATVNAETTFATTRATKLAAGVPKLDAADARAEWERVTMLLDAGASLPQVMRGADPARLQAIQQWGPTYLDAQAIKGRPGGIIGHDQGADLETFERQLRDRWAEVLPNGEYITAGIEAAGIAAEFTRTAQTFSNELTGERNSYEPLGEALAAQEAGQLAAANFNPLTAGE